MHDNFTLRLTYTSTGIVAEAVNRGGQILASREISKGSMLHWVADHADRAAAIEFDAAITAAIERDEEAHDRLRQPSAAHGNLVGIFDQCALINRLACGLEEVAS